MLIVQYELNGCKTITLLNFDLGGQIKNHRPRVQVGTQKYKKISEFE